MYFSKIGTAKKKRHLLVNLKQIVYIWIQYIISTEFLYRNELPQSSLDRKNVYSCIQYIIIIEFS